MQTLEVSEFINYEPSLGSNTWLTGLDVGDIPVVDVIDAIIEGHLPTVTTLGFLIEKAVLTEAQCIMSGVCIEQQIGRPTDAIPTLTDLTTCDFRTPELLVKLEDARQAWRDYRPRTMQSKIHMYLLGAINGMYLGAMLFTAVSSSGVFKNHVGLAGRTLSEAAGIDLKMAFYHFVSNHSVSKVKMLLRSVKDVIVDNPPMFSSDYETGASGVEGQ